MHRPYNGGFVEGDDYLEGDHYLMHQRLIRITYPNRRLFCAKSKPLNYVINYVIIEPLNAYILTMTAPDWSILDRRPA